MKISTKGEYGIRAMLYLALHADDGTVTSHQIASHQGIPEPYLRQILAQLSKNHLIHSNRGPQGGHVLARPASEISIRDVIIPLEGQTTSVDQILSLQCKIDIGTEHCAIRELLLEVKGAVDHILQSTTLADLAHRQAQILRSDIRIPPSLGCAETSAEVEEELLPVLR